MCLGCTVAPIELVAPDTFLAKNANSLIFYELK
jgi:hypothetical protein